MIWLGIDTANAPLSVAIVKDGKTLAEIKQNIRLTHSVGAMPAIEELFTRVNMKPAEIDAIAVSEGPGSYTGVRIGVSIAKTLAWTLKKPLVGVSSLKALAANVSMFNGLICPLVDARRQNVYTALYEGTMLEEVMEDTHEHIDELLIKLKMFDRPVLFVGTDVDLYKEHIEERIGALALYAPSSQSLPSASEIIRIAETMSLPEVDATHNFTPQYRRIAEAEANWIKDQKEKDHGSLS
jgi:tRNA threonylcarbamoyladenosine biosynthesis protein TsaB